jgi:1-acyl-sn-glycerol-3-phosphate acyltransferase
LAFGNTKQIHIVAKAEIFKYPVISQIVKKLGMISVDRGNSDVKSIKTILRYLKDNEKVAMFPEGTRSRQDGDVAAKNGAIMIAERSGVSIVPVFVPRKKPLFRPLTVVIGEKYLISKTTRKRTAQDYTILVSELMEKIKDLNPAMKSPV